MQEKGTELLESLLHYSKLELAHYKNALQWIADKEEDKMWSSDLSRYAKQALEKYNPSKVKP